LYREFRTSRATDHVAGALQLMLGPAADPDYQSLWPAGTTLTALSRSADVQQVSLSQAPTQPDIAVQEVVYTVTATDPTVHRVSVSYPGGGVGATGRGTSWVVLAPVWVLSPLDGATVSSPVRISGTASVFEA